MTDNSESIHKGHRQRVKQKFLEYGLDVFEDHEVLELMLFFALPRGDVNGIAHSMIGAFGSLPGVFSASFSELSEVPGVGDNAALLVRLMSQLERRIRISGETSRGRLKVRSSDDAGNLLVPYFIGAVEEQLYIMTLTSAGTVIRCHLLQTGSVAELFIDFRKLVSVVLNDGAAMVIAAHNHLSGIALPSRADISTTNKMQDALTLIGVKLADHLVVCGDDWVSMKESGLIK